jgi:hypothetical protein
MVQVQQRFLGCFLACALAWAADYPSVFPTVAVPAGRKFYPDDPLLKAPLPRTLTTTPRSRNFNDLYDLFSLSLTDVGERQPKARKTAAPKIPAVAGNTLGEVPDSLDWYTNRHSLQKPMSLDDLTKGPNVTGPPSMDGSWAVLSAKNQGVTPGFVVRDSAGRRYFIKFDPPSNPEMATAADVIGSHFFHALGYYVPENYVVQFSRDQFVVDSKASITEFTGRKRKMTVGDVDEILRNISNGAGKFRATASLFIGGDIIGPFRYYGMRQDDVNDVFPHEHRRDLRGLSVFCAWLGHDDSRSINTLDAVIEEQGRKFVRHQLIDFGSILGSASTKANSARSGHDYLFGWKPAAKEFLSFGFYLPYWAKTSFPDFPSVGRFEYQAFDPERYRPEYPNPAFLNALPEDHYWAAKKVMAFTDEQIRAIVKTGQYSDLGAESWVIECLINRRDKIGRVYLNQVLAVDHFDASGDELRFEDLAVRFKFASPRTYSTKWFSFDDKSNARQPMPSPGFRFPQAIGYYGVEISATGTKAVTTVYFRQTAQGREVVGIDRTAN